ncbi:DNA-directed RNA polymerase subunit delta [Bacillus sp. ISL-47]|uniref:DNA-directed RNA polymerase subunit delta n=1 Tax=Bacillus sp. ISL-47 TaxID=2819130 RepID=UPI001BEB5653|nr:DNA-directed RNA polymerase subunit delta [Bacillus sp. ISL-47]MBT2688663.1 DNA-directed RNA polymerase subunit delta [Bacillus sp. ISL-47]MBT2710649.1 DNA-directed RNA polymerase subunit delta [Pseudomonas sp. ISL-84]
MSLEQFSKEELQEMSLIEVAYELLKSKKEPMAFNDIMDEVTKILNLSKEQVKSKIAQFYTDLNIDGHFIGLGDNRWGLRSWYPVDQYEEEVVSVIKPKKKKAKKKVADDDLDLEDYDELDEEDIDYDDDGFDDDDLTDDDDDDLLDDDDDLDEDFEDDAEIIDKDEEEFDLDEDDDDDDLEEDELELDEDEEDL